MKTYFIGIGGCGLLTVSEIQKRLMVLPDAEQDYEFTYIDTDRKTYEDINSKGIVISSNDFKNMGDTNPAAVYNNILHKEHRTADEERFLEWVIPQEPGHMVLENSPLNDGAKAFRNLGRIAIYNHYNNIVKELTAKIGRFQSSKPDPKTNTRDVDIWVVASACGGTGSSNLLDILYLINNISNPVVLGNGVPNLKLVLFMPQPFVLKNGNNLNYPLNAYSCLWELNAFRNAYETGNTKTFEMFAVRPTEMGKTILEFPLYKFVIPVDVETNTNTKLNVDTNYFPTIAEMIYYLTYGKGANEMVSRLSNDVADMKPDNGRSRSLITYGYRAIRKPNRELKEYLRTRGLYEILKFGLLDKNKLNKIKEEKVRFANDSILAKLVELQGAKFEEDGSSYDFSGITLDEESLQNQITNWVNGCVKYDPSALDSDTLKLQLKRLSSVDGALELKEIKDNVSSAIKKSIDRNINDIIIQYGVEFAYELLNTVDDFYLEPLYRYIKENLIPELNNALTKSKIVCEKYADKGYRKGKYEEVGGALKKYKEALISQIAFSAALDIIKDLTEAPTGYLETIRKGERNGFVGLRQLKKALSDLCDEYENQYAELAEKFRETKNDAMTVYLPNLADIATGEDNKDWKDGNFFDELYQGSILEQEEFDNGYEKILVPKRSSASSKGLADYLKLLDPDFNLFSDIIKDKSYNLELNVEKKLKLKLERIIDEQANNTQTSAGEFINQELKEIINRTSVLPKSIYKTSAELFNDFKDTSRVPVFFPLKAGETLPAKMRLMFVGNDEDLAKNLGYKETENTHKWVMDENMKDRFMIMRMPIGLSFDMYKYFPEYKNTYCNPTINDEVRNKEYGCHIHQIFNENNNFQEIIIRKRLNELINCLFYQNVADLLKEKDKVAFNKLFGFAADSLDFGGETIEIDGLDDIYKENNINSSNKDISSFISITPDFKKRRTMMVLKNLKYNIKNNLLEIDDTHIENIELDESQTMSCRNFTNKILTLSSTLFVAANYFKLIIDKDPNLAESVKKVTDEAKRMLTLPYKEVDGIKTNKFGAALFVWKKLDKIEDKPIISTIESIIKSI